MSNANRFLRRITEDPRCFLCGEVEENIEHILRKCPAAILTLRNFPWLNDGELFSKIFLEWLE